MVSNASDVKTVEPMLITGSVLPVEQESDGSELNSEQLNEGYDEYLAEQEKEYWQDKHAEWYETYNR